jgi:AbrB family looped-hinge helix DNA binding protein
MNITSKGQVTIPKKLREKYGLSEHVELEFLDEGGSIRLVKKGLLSPFDKAYGLLAAEQDTDSLIEALRGPPPKQ